MIGNAVPVNLAYEIAVGIKKALETLKEKPIDLPPNLVQSKPKVAHQLSMF